MRSTISLLVLLLASGVQAQQVYRCINPAQTELGYADKPCPEGAHAALVDVTPNSAATAAALAQHRDATAAGPVAPTQPNPPVHNPFKSQDEPDIDMSNAWAKGTPKSQASSSFDQQSLQRGPAGVPSK